MVYFGFVMTFFSNPTGELGFHDRFERILYFFCFVFVIIDVLKQILPIY